MVGRWVGTVRLRGSETQLSDGGHSRSVLSGGLQGTAVIVTAVTARALLEGGACAAPGRGYCVLATYVCAPHDRDARFPR